MNVLVVSPHPDDETLGAGATILKRKRMGDHIYWLNLTNVDQGMDWDERFVKRRRQQIVQIRQFYGFDDCLDLHYETAALEEIKKRELIGSIAAYFEKIKPGWVILPDPNDSHKDHRITYESCMACTKIFRFPYVKRITTMEILSETEFGDPANMFVPNYFVDVTDVFEKKIEALQIYDTELGAPPFPRSLEAVRFLGTFRGGMAGVRYAEAFKIIKWIE